MAEGLLNRVKRLVSGSVNSIVDVVENAAPETVMKESIREIDAAIDDVRSQLGIVIANKHHANKRLMEASAKHEDLAEKLQFAVEQGRDDLAEAAIGRQFDLEAQIPILEDALKSASEEESELESYISALSGRRREMEEDLQSYLASRPAEPGETPASGGGGGGRSADRRVEDAESAFNRVLRSATGIPGTVKTDRDTAAKLAELEQVSRENRIKERLAAVKAVKPSSS
ncbi:MAG: PspA/IM30 family protein [Rhodobiaceae bacterium]|nr:PspA/IM30 family protein [Rhodobiaceae bacterium]